jgi:hypothetical protein
VQERQREGSKKSQWWFGRQESMPRPIRAPTSSEYM